MSSSPTRQLRFARIAMVVQAAALAVLIGQSIPQYLDYVLHPSTCTPDGWCMDLRGLEFELSVIFLGPPLLLLLVTSWLWRRPRRWPAVLPTLVDLAFIGLVIYDVVSAAQNRHDQNPPVLAQVVLVLFPAVASLTALLPLLRRQADSPPAPSNPTNIAS